MFPTPLPCLTVRPLSVLMCLLLLAAPAVAESPAVTFTIANPLNLAWPWEPTHRDFPAGTFEADTSYVAVMDDVRRPVQIERIGQGDEAIDRAWFVATVPRAGDKGDTGLTVRIEPGEAATPLRVKRDGSLLTIENTPVRLRLRSVGPLDEPRPLRELPHWFAGIAIGADKPFVGAAWFDSDALVREMRIEIVQQGPVFCDVRISIVFADAKTDGEAVAMPLRMGKQSHTFEPNVMPTETLAKESPHYTAILRVVMGDPWVEVNERYHLGDADYTLHFGNRAKVADRIPAAAKDDTAQMKVDTTMRVRWFEYDQFGGNTDLNIEPAVERDIQKGRPFARLQPRWTQGGGGAQELLLTTGGKDAADADAPCVGIVATFASKWVAPYQSIIHAYAADGDRGWYDFPLSDGRSADRHYGQRSYAIVAGPRSLFDNTGRLNSLVRRHTDWTLVAQMNKYILRWERDPSRAGPRVLLSPEKLATIRAALKADDRGNPYVAAVRRTQAEKAAADKAAAELQARIKTLEAEAKSAGDEVAREKAAAALAEAREALRHQRSRVSSDDERLLTFLTEGKGSGGSLPSVDLWLGRRYQDDFLNPTSFTRRVHNWGWPDLFAAGEPIGSAIHAAAAYVFADPDHWPGWHHGWSPGNPNFHTDKYMVTLYAGAVLRDHPHSDEWLAFGQSNFNDDLRRVLIPPDGVGWECPGYSGYSFGLQLKIARAIANTGFGNPIASNPMTRATGIWHRKLITPPDTRLGLRHEAPHGDTHRWTSGMGFSFAKLATFYATEDADFATEMLGTWQLLIDSGMYGGSWEPTLTQIVFDLDPTLEPMAAKDMDWSSQAFHGFGVIFRNHFGSPRETFLSMKVGPARGHYHNDEMAFHYYVNNTPISLDYNCSYSPRADHAALHNAMTFGREATVLHNGRNEQVPAQEQIHGTAHVLASAMTDVADAVVAERKSDRLVMSPIDPKDHEFSRGYPARTVDPITHRRTLAMIRHGKDSRLTDYLVVLDESDSTEPQQLNLHVLARDAKVDGRTITLDGQLDHDVKVVLAAATEPAVQVRSYHYLASKGAGPITYAIEPGESVEAWHTRLQAMMKQAGAESLPLPGDQEPIADAKAWQARIAATDGRALAVPPFWNERWMWGEYQTWLRIETKPGTPTLWVMYAHPKGRDVPTIEPLDDGRAVRVTLGAESETVRIRDNVLTVTRGEVTTKVLDLP